MRKTNTASSLVKSAILAAGLSASTATLPASVLAQITNPVVGTYGSDAEAAASGSLFATYFVMLWRSAISIGAFMVLIYFIWGAYEWMGSAGDNAKLEKARNRMTNAMIGIFLLVGTFVIINYISFLFFGDEFQILNLNFTSGI